MLTLITCKGYRALRDHTELALGPLNVIFGRNNSGKTTITRLPLFVAGSLHQSELYTLQTGDLRFGSSFRDLTSVEDPHPTLAYSAMAANGEGFAVTLQSVTRGLKDDVQILRISDHSSDLSFPLGHTMTEDESSRVDDMRLAQHGLRNMLEPYLHISSTRPPILPVYEARAAVGANASEAPYLLYEYPHLLDAVREWMASHFDGLDLDVDVGEYSFRLVSREHGQNLNLASAGRGLQSLVPIAVLVHAATLGIVPCRLMVIEEPEVHLHPSAHTAMAELMATASQTAQVFVETHSENLLLRLRRKIAIGEMLTTHLCLTFVDELRQLTAIPVDADGAVHDWPTGVFEYDLEEARAIVQARLRSIRRQ